MQIIIVADAHKQRLALSDTIHRLGFCVLDCINTEQLLNEQLPHADVWLVDVDNYTPSIQAKILETRPKSVLMGFKTAPYLNNSCDYEKWQRSLMRRLSKLLNLSPAQNKSPQQKEFACWRYVLFLGGSMGGPEAIKTFLDNLPANLPIAIIIAQHFEGVMMESLPKILTRHNEWRCKLITTTQSLQAGTCLIAPVDKQIVCDSTGRVILTKKDWEGEYRPNIGALLKNASEVHGSDLIGIIFSGMGVDGSQHAKELRANNSLLWAQDPETCISPSQPQAFIDTGMCQYIGSPEAMAARLSRLFSAYSTKVVDFSKEETATIENL